MQNYDDFALCPEKFEDMAKEYIANQGRINSLSAKIGGGERAAKSEIERDDIDLLFKKIEYLRVLVSDLKMRTSNPDALAVLDNVSSDILEQNKNLSILLNAGAMAFDHEDEQMDMFCNNLKVAINTASDIVKLLIKIKDDDETFQLSPALTESINSFLEINNQLVSLFGECRYRGFSLFRK